MSTNVEQVLVAPDQAALEAPVAPNRSFVEQTPLAAEPYAATGIFYETINAMRQAAQDEVSEILARAEERRTGVPLQREGSAQSNFGPLLSAVRTDTSLLTTEQPTPLSDSGYGFKDILAAVHGDEAAQVKMDSRPVQDLPNGDALLTDARARLDALAAKQDQASAALEASPAEPDADLLSVAAAEPESRIPQPDTVVPPEQVEEIITAEDEAAQQAADRAAEAFFADQFATEQGTEPEVLDQELAAHAAADPEVIASRPAVIEVMTGVVEQPAGHRDPAEQVFAHYEDLDSARSIQDGAQTTAERDWLDLDNQDGTLAVDTDEPTQTEAPAEVIEDATSDSEPVESNVQAAVPPRRRGLLSRAKAGVSRRATNIANWWRIPDADDEFYCQVMDTGEVVDKPKFNARRAGAVVVAAALAGSALAAGGTLFVRAVAADVASDLRGPSIGAKANSLTDPFAADPALAAQDLFARRNLITEILDKQSRVNFEGTKPLVVDPDADKDPKTPITTYTVAETGDKLEVGAELLDDGREVTIARITEAGLSGQAAPSMVATIQTPNGPSTITIPPILNTATADDPDDTTVIDSSDPDAVEQALTAVRAAYNN